MQKIRRIRKPWKSHEGFQFRQHQIQHWKKFFSEKKTQSGIRDNSFQIREPKTMGWQHRLPMRILVDQITEDRKDVTRDTDRRWKLSAVTSQSRYTPD